MSKTPLAQLGLAIGLLGIVGGIQAPAHAQQVPLTQPLGPAIAVQDNTEGATVITGVAGYNDYPSGMPPWKLAQWGIPENLAPAPGAATGWAIGNMYGQVEYYPSSGGHANVYRLAQGAGLCNHEVDMFLAPVGNPGDFTDSQPLDSLGSLMVGAGVIVDYVSIPGECTAPNPPDSLQYVISLILNSTSNQVLFYQINLGRFPALAPNPNVGWCPSYEYANDGQFCLDDQVGNAGGTEVAGGDVFNYFEFLPRLLQVITAGHVKPAGPALDTNPANWRVTSVYVGQIVQGKSVATSRWYEPKVATMPGGNFCSAGNAIQWVCGPGTPEGGGWVPVGDGCFHRNTGKACF